MAVTGPFPKENSRNRGKITDWKEYENTPNEPRPVPKVHGVKFRVAVVEWWNIICRMPHTVDWKESDWQFAVETMLLREAWWKTYARNGNPQPSVMVELRRRDDQMGTTMEARRKLRIRYIEPRISESEIEAIGASSVSSLADRRKAILQNSD